MLRVPHADLGEPDTRGPLRYIWWLAWRQRGRVLRGAAIGTVWMIGLSARPYLVSKAIDAGLRRHDNRALLLWTGAIVAAGILLANVGIMRHRTMTYIREDATARSAGLLLRQLPRAGAVLPRRLAAGDVATVGGTDIARVSQVLTLTGPGVGAIVAYTVVAFVLWNASPLLALCILLGVPAIALTVGPLLRRLERAESVYRQQQGELTTRAGDIVAGLRVLAGVGGRGLFGRRYEARSRYLLAEGYRVGAVRSWIDALTVVIPGLFLAAVVWLAARMAATGQITIGQLVAVYGYVATLVMPVFFMLEGAYDVIQGRVSARRIIALLQLVRDEAGGPADRPAPPHGADLYDPESGLTAPAGRLLVIAADDPGAALALADRLARYVDSDVTWGGEALRRMPLDEVRARIQLADHDSYLFAGSLRQILGGDGQPAIERVLHVASAHDVVDSLPGGIEAAVDDRGRTLSGGQRQRVRLARALLREPEVLILVEPTSAVDAHTESRIAARLREARSRRTTVVFSTSPLLLGAADLVAHLGDGRITATGRHGDLLAQSPPYRALVSREETVAP
jgi:ABC-type multidrug transport system fused ATPase/permease subunit